jgi:radical SAM superfamily enzyme YgiQ (UPF0313 family)
MSNLGFQSLFHSVSLFHGVRAYRHFIEKDNQILSPDTPESITIRDSDIILFSVSFELDYPNILRMLTGSSIPPLREDRHGYHPTVVIGGIAPTANPDILSPFVDVVFTGEMECGLDDILRVMMAHTFQKSDRMLEELAAIRGAWVPAMGDGSTRQRVVVEQIEYPAHSAILARDTVFSDRFLVEIGRGCRNRCRFCMTRCMTHPLRSVRKERVVHTVRRAIPHTDRVGLIAPVLTDHRELPSIVGGINRLGMKVSFSSLRADDFDQEVAKLLVQNHQRTVTFAPETGSVELRKRMGKTLTDRAIMRAIVIALENGITRFRFYLMFGLPGETDRDIRAIGGLVQDTVRILEKREGHLHISLNPFVPKKGTPLEAHPLYPLSYYRENKKNLEQLLGRFDAVSYRFETLRNLQLHYYLSMGGSDVGLLLLHCVRMGTFRGFAEAAEEKMGRTHGS